MAKYVILLVLFFNISVFSKTKFFSDSNEKINPNKGNEAGFSTGRYVLDSNIEPFSGDCCHLNVISPEVISTPEKNFGKNIFAKMKEVLDQITSPVQDK